MFVSSLLLSLLPDAHATKIKNVRVKDVQTGDVRVVAITPDADTTVASVAGELDGAPVSFTDSDAWVHGTATLHAAPADGAALTLTVYDSDSVAIDTFTGTYKGGALTLTSTTPADGCTTKPCDEADSTATTRWDLEVLAAQVYADGTVGIDLAGADTFAVAYAKLSSVETTSVSVCVASDKSGCVKWETKTSSTTDAAELDLDALGIVWTSDTVAVDGAAELEVKAYDAVGKKLDKVKVTVATPWEDGGDGVHALALDDDPFTTLAVISDQLHNGGTVGFVVASDGWSLGDALPEVAAIELEGGETWSVPVNSYQVTALVSLGVMDLDAIGSIAVDGVEATEVVSMSLERIRRKWFSMEVARRDLHSAAAFTTGDDGGVWLSMTAWSTDPDALPTGVVLTIDGVDTEVAFEDTVAAVFAIDAERSTDADGMDLVGTVKLQGAANKKGKRDTLAKGKFAGQFGVDTDGDPDLAARNKDNGTVSRGDILIGGEPIDIERTGTPPVVMSVSNNGRMSAQLCVYR